MGRRNKEKTNGRVWGLMICCCSLRINMILKFFYIVFLESWTSWLRLINYYCVNIGVVACFVLHCLFCNSTEIFFDLINYNFLNVLIVNVNLFVLILSVFVLFSDDNRCEITGFNIIAIGPYWALLGFMDELGNVVHLPKWARY